MSNQMPNKFNYRMSNLNRSGVLAEQKHINQRVIRLEDMLKNGKPDKNFDMFMKDEYLTEADESVKYGIKKLKFSGIDISSIYEYLKSLAKNDPDNDVYEVIGKIKKEGADYFKTIDISSMSENLIKKLCTEAENIKGILKSKNRDNKDIVYGMFDVLNVMDRTNKITEKAFDKKVDQFLEKIGVDFNDVHNQLNVRYAQEAIRDLLTADLPVSFNPKANKETILKEDPIVFSNKVDIFKSKFRKNKLFQEELASLRKDFLNTDMAYKYVLNVDRFKFNEKNNFSFLATLGYIADKSNYDVKTLTDFYKDSKNADISKINIIPMINKNIDQLSEPLKLERISAALVLSKNITEDINIDNIGVAAHSLKESGFLKTNAEETVVEDFQKIYSEKTKDQALDSFKQAYDELEF